MDEWIIAIAGWAVAVLVVWAMVAINMDDWRP